MPFLRQNIRRRQPQTSSWSTTLQSVCKRLPTEMSWMPGRNPLACHSRIRFLLTPVIWLAWEMLNVWVSLFMFLTSVKSGMRETNHCLPICIRLVYSGWRDRIWDDGETDRVIDRPPKWRFFVPWNIINSENLDDPDDQDGLCVFKSEALSCIRVLILATAPLWASRALAWQSLLLSALVLCYSFVEIQCPN